MAKQGNPPSRGNATMTELRALDVRPVVVVGREAAAPTVASSPPRGPVAEVLAQQRPMTVIRPHGGASSGPITPPRAQPQTPAPSGQRALANALASPPSDDDLDEDDIRTRKTVQELDARAALDALAAIDRARDEGRLSFPQLAALATAPAPRPEDLSGVYYEEPRRDRAAPEREMSAAKSRPVWSTQAGRSVAAAAPPVSSQAMTVMPAAGRLAPQPQGREAAPRANLGQVRVNRVPLSGEATDLRLFMQRRPDSAQAAAFRVLRYRVEQGQVPGTTVLAVSAAQAGHGTTTAAANLALALSECERARVCLVEGNLRRPALARMLRFRPPQCLVERLAQDRQQPLTPWDVAEIAPGLHVMAISESATPQALLDGPAFASCIESLRRAGYSYVVIDGPEVLGIADMNLIEETADRVLLVAQGGVTHAADLRRATAQLAGPKLMGAVLLDGEEG